jgi:predicted dehydrogenase
MAEDLGHAEQMITVCKRNDVKLVIAHQRRFLPSYNKARELIAEGAIGDVDLIRIYSRDGLLNWSSHQFDMARYVLGDDECTWVMGSVERLTDRWERSTRIEDKAVATFGFASGANAILLSDTQPEYHQGGLIVGTEGMIDLHTEHLRLLNATTGGQWEKHAPNGRFFATDAEGYGFDFAEGFSFEYAEGAAGQVDELADWVEGKVETHRGEATHGYKAIEMALAVYESARLHEVVSLPLQTRVSPLDLMVESDHLPVRYPGKYDIRARVLRGENFATVEENV